jgi:hypothetical protein
MMFVFTFGAAPQDVGGNLIPTAYIQFHGSVWSELVVIIGHHALICHSSLKAAIP